MLLSRRHLLLSAAAAGCVPGSARSAEAGGPISPEFRPNPVVLEARRVRLPIPGADQDRDILSFDGSVRGPVLRIREGEGLDLRLVNSLDAPLALDWHGVRGPGGPLADRVPPGGRREVSFNPPDRGLYWFHSAALTAGPDWTAAGLRGMLIVEEAMPPAADQDVLIAIAEWRLAGGGPAVLTVNGAEAPARVGMAPGGRLRLRVVNATTTRAMILAFEGARPFVIAIDGQPSDLFEPVRDSVPVGPGARFEFMIDLPREADAALRMVLRDGSTQTVLFEAATAGAPRADALPPIAALPRNPQLPPAIPLEKSARANLRIEAVTKADGKAARWRVNGTASVDLAGSPLLKVNRGSSVTLGFDNRSGAIVPLRIQGHVMRLLHARDDGWEPYWRDSVILLPDSTNHVAFVAGDPGRWLLQSALFDQAAFGLRTWFEVI